MFRSKHSLTASEDLLKEPYALGIFAQLVIDLTNAIKGRQSIFMLGTK